MEAGQRSLLRPLRWVSNIPVCVMSQFTDAVGVFGVYKGRAAAG